MRTVIRAILMGGLGLGLGWTAPATPVTHEPANLDALKQEIRVYFDSGQYERDIAAVTAEAGAWLDQRAKQDGGRLTVVFDLDETLLSNWPHMLAQGFVYVPDKWTAWLAEGDAPVIPSVRDLYRQARRLGLAVVFLSGRFESDRPGTEKNLRAIGCGDYAELIFKPDGLKETTGAFKLAQRRRLQAEGYVIIASIGDQVSDFAGGGAERTFKLPDPFYIIE